MYLKITKLHTINCRTLPAYLVSLVPSVLGFVMFFFCPVSTALAKVSGTFFVLCSLNFVFQFQHYGTRPVALTGAITVTVSVAISAIIDDFYWFFIFFSIFGGLGSGLILVQVHSYIYSFHSEYRQ
jgi:MFS family permease